MRKVIFEGTINGKTFNSVQEYNKEMQRILTSGAINVQASSSTRIVDESEEQQQIRKGVELPENTRFDINRFLPLFNNDSRSYYLDLLVSDDDAINQNNINITSAKLESDWTDLKNIIKNGTLDISDAINFLNAIKEIRTKLADDAKSNTAAAYDLKNRIDITKKKINDLNKLVEADSKRLKVVDNAIPVINTVASYYNEAFNIVKDYILNI